MKVLRSADSAEPAEATKVRRVPALRARTVQAHDEMLAHRDVGSQRIFAAAMAGEFVCVFCAHPGPHDDIGHGQGSEIAFACARCGKHLDEKALKNSVNRPRACPPAPDHDST